MTYRPPPQVVTNAAFAAMPAASFPPGWLVWVSDVNNGTLYENNAAQTAWTQLTAGVTGFAGKELAYVELTANPTGFTTTVADVTGMSITFTAPSGNFIVEAQMQGIQASPAAVTVVLQLTDSANILIDEMLVTDAATGGWLSIFLKARLPRVGGTGAYPITPGNSYTFKVRANLGAGGTSGGPTVTSNIRPFIRAVTC